MENKDAVFRQRKELKKRAHKVVRSHFFVLVFLALIMSLFGTEFTQSLSGWGKQADAQTSAKGPGSILDLDDFIYDPADRLFSSNDVLKLISQGRLQEGETRAEELSRQLLEKGEKNKVLGRTRGILAQVANGFGSGRLFIMLAKSIRSATKSDEMTTAIFVAISFLLFALVFIFLKNVYSAVIRRVYLQARVYEHVSLLDVTHFAAVKKWIHASWVMLVQYLYLILWSLTIVGGIIKYFSYWAVPYIVAENPAIGAKEAVTLSRKMMNGHKLELLKYQLTMAGWILLGIVTFGISEFAYGISYRLACYSEFYAKIREQAFAEEVENIHLLNDPCLFAPADRILLYETYFEVVDEITLLHENRVELTGWRKVVADWFGLWIGSIRRKKAYDDYEGRMFTVQRYKLSMEGKAYPLWLNPLCERREMEKNGNFHYLRHYTVWTLFLLFVAFCVLGWTWEVALHFMQTGQFANRGTLHGPWLPIYGTGGIIVLMLCSRFRKKPVVEFFTAIALCGVLEYFSGWYLEMKYHQRWWSYDGYFLNLHGRICAEGLLVFGVGCCVVVYVVAPVFDYLLSKVKTKILIGISVALFIIYAADVIYSSGHPNMAKGAVEAVPQEEPATELPGEALTELPEAGTESGR